MNLLSGWATLWGQVPAGWRILLAAGGVLIIIVSIAIWLYKKRKGNGAPGGFPTVLVILGGLMAGPELIVPVILLVATALLTVLSAIVTWAAGFLGS